MKPGKTDDVGRLAESFAGLKDVRQFDEDGVRQADILAEGLSHISESVDGFQNLFLRLQAPGLSDEQKLDLLWEIGEELRHIDGHIHDMAFFDSQIDDESAEGLDS